MRPEPEEPLPPAGRIHTPAEALDLVGHGANPEAVGPLTGPSILVVRADRRADLDALVHVVRDLPCVTVGVAGSAVDDPPELDVLLSAEPDPPRPWVGAPDGVDAALAPLIAATDSAPQAAVVLVQVLRASAAGLDVAGALILESLAFSTLQAGQRFGQWLAQRPVASDRSAAPDTAEPAVLIERTDDGHCLDVVLNRPRRRNAVDVRLRDELVQALRIASADDTITEIRLRGNGPAFCSGGDLSDFGTAEDPATSHVVRTTRGPAWWTAHVAHRLTAEVHGACVGAGVELSAFATRVVARSDTTFRLPEVAMGLIPGSGGTVSIPRRIGRQRCAYLALSGVAIDAAVALRWGLVDDVVG